MITAPSFDAQYRQTSNINRTLGGKKIVDHADVVGASPVGAAPTTSSFSIKHMTSLDCAKTTTRRNERHLIFGICVFYIRGLKATVSIVANYDSDSQPFQWMPTENT